MTTARRAPAAPNPRKPPTSVPVVCLDCACNTTLASISARLLRDRSIPIGRAMRCTDAGCSCHQLPPTDLNITLDVE